jgi:alpha-tubulin suppressor-like RCC1 family protein
MNVKLWDFVKLSEGWYHSMALSSHGLVWIWGYGASGRLGMGNSNNQTSPVYLSNLFGSSDTSNPVLHITDISANYSSSYAVDEYGNVWAWGSGSDYALGNDSTSLINNTPLLIASNAGAVKVTGYYHTGAFLTDNGAVYSWGENSRGAAGNGDHERIHTPTLLTTLPAVKDISIGHYAGAAIDMNGDLWTWGGNNNGQLGVGFSGSGSSSSFGAIASDEN